jgi:DNA-binding NarL/FixJ family response regulator
VTPLDTHAPVRVLVVDDQRLLADALCLALRRAGLQPELAPITCRDALVARVHADPPALVLLDLDLGGALGDGTDLVAPCVAAGSRVLVLSGTTDELWIAAALEQGACAAVDKAVPFDDLLRVVLSAARGDTVLAPSDRHLFCTSSAPTGRHDGRSSPRSSRSRRASSRCSGHSRPG